MSKASRAKQLNNTLAKDNTENNLNEAIAKGDPVVTIILLGDKRGIKGDEERQVLTSIAKQLIKNGEAKMKV